MAAKRRVIDVTIGLEDLERLGEIARSRTEATCRVERARILLAYHADPSLYAASRVVGVATQTIERCLRRAQRLGVMAALDDSPRPGKARVITPEARLFLIDLACRKPGDFGYPHELWSTRLLADHAREHGPREGHPSLSTLVQGTLCKILNAHQLKPHKVRYYVEKRDPDFAAKMAEVLCVYREVALLKQAKAKTGEANTGETGTPDVAIVSYDEKPGIQAIATTTKDLPPVPDKHPSLTRDYEYVRHGTLSLLAGIDLLTGQVHACCEDRHRSREFIGFLERLDRAYAPDTAIKIILDNHSAHVSKETVTWLDQQREGRFTFVFTPKHGSWLNIVEGFFSKLARSVLREIRVASKEELKARIMAAIDAINEKPVVHNWTYQIDEAA